MKHTNKLKDTLGTIAAYIVYFLGGMLTVMAFIFIPLTMCAMIGAWKITAVQIIVIIVCIVWLKMVSVVCRYWGI